MGNGERRRLKADLGGPELLGHFPKDGRQAPAPLPLRPFGGPEEVLDPALGAHGGLPTLNKGNGPASVYPYDPGRNPFQVAFTGVGHAGAFIIFVLAPTLTGSES